MLNCVELMPATRRDGARRDGTDGPTPGGRAGGRRAGCAPPPPLIGPRRTCPYKAATRRIPAAADFLSPRGRRGPPPGRAPHPRGPAGTLRQGGAGAPLACSTRRSLALSPFVGLSFLFCPDDRRGGIVGWNPSSLEARMRTSLFHLEAPPCLGPLPGSPTTGRGTQEPGAQRKQGSLELGL